ncbi:hypothetical protein FN846DRAFT_406174 [Sphaerosporella brunnea]|uniref:Alpha/Beta hydrolase protein n=1 Tax=Sphaerosporella brunnea TaxID=1250544 RepID=A0A5J5EHU0_9PEZI|nr:hypothetical protein FN846DRAFT_406174 [Sphaerosporella brunnea]
MQPIFEHSPHFNPWSVRISFFQRSRSSNSTMSDLSLLNGIIVLLLTSIVGIQLSTVILRRREKTERNELQIAPDDRKPTPHSAAPKRADRPPTDTELSTSPDHHLTERISSVELTATDHSRPRQKRSPLCFRITGVPQDWDKEKLQKALHLENDDLSILPACNHLRKTRTALLRLDSLGWEQKQIIVNEQGRCVRLTIDKNFYGLTALNDPVTPITADIIAITGLAGNAFGSWQHRDSQAMWLYDFLPHYFPSARIMTYGYNSSLLEPNGARLIDHRKSFIEALRNARVDCPERPIIFIGHSLGGILVAQTMLQSFLRGRERISVHGDIYGGIYNLVKGIFFFGTPHRGLNVEDLRDMVALQAEKDEHRQLLDQLDNDSEFLGNQKEACMAMWENFPGRVCSFYETGKTETVVSVSLSPVFITERP